MTTQTELLIGKWKCYNIDNEHFDQNGQILRKGETNMQHAKAWRAGTKGLHYHAEGISLAMVPYIVLLVVMVQG